MIRNSFIQFILLVLYCSSPNTLHAAKDIKFHRITVADGLSQSSVLRIIQDKTGFMWFSTQDGLNRYNGYDFTVFKRETEHPEGLPCNTISAIYEDKGGTLWMGCNAGLIQFLWEKEAFQKYLMIPYKDDLSINRPKGCENCNQIGYRGRMALHELLMGTDDMKRLIQEKAKITEIRGQAVRDGMMTLKQDGIEKIFAGKLDLLQVRKVCIK